MQAHSAPQPRFGQGTVNQVLLPWLCFDGDVFVAQILFKRKALPLEGMPLSNKAHEVLLEQRLDAKWCRNR